MKLSALIRRRLLLNYRADPDVVAPLLPDGLRVQLVDGAAVVGICLVRLEELRPRRVPGWVGLVNESAAHRIAVEADGCPAVYVHRRDTGSLLATAAGGRLFPGVHDRARFAVEESPERWQVSCRGQVSIDVDASVVDQPTGTLFADIDEATRFFRAGAVGLSPSRADGPLEAVELVAPTFDLTPLRIDDLRSSWFDDHARFPADSLQLDSGFLMRDVPVMWEPRTG